MTMRATHVAILGGTMALLCAAAGCWQEELRQADITGVVKIPVEMVTSSQELGIVFVGLYADASDEVLGFTYPFMGPVVGSNDWGDSYPYGGTTVGGYAFPCVIEGKCRMVTGRYPDLDAVIDALQIGQGEDPPWDAEAYWDVCQEYFGYTEPEELEFVGVDRLAFYEQDGYYVADWKMWHVDPQDDADARPVLWAFEDAGLQSCNPDSGPSNRLGSPFFYEGEVFEDVLNMPGKYLTPGDRLSSAPTPLEVEKRDGYEIVLDTVFEG